jgi:hypothetical protein
VFNLLTSLLAKVALIRLLLKGFGSLGVLLPVAFLLKLFGLPLLIVLAILAIPLLVVLAVIGLPLIAVIVVGGILLTVVGSVLSIGLMALKIVLPIVLIVWVLRWALGKGKPAGGSTPASDIPGAEGISPTA